MSLAMVENRGPTGGLQFVGAKSANKSGSTSGWTSLSLSSGLAGGIDTSVADGDLIIAIYVFATGEVTYDAASARDGNTSTAYTLIGRQDEFNVWCSESYAGYRFADGDTDVEFGRSFSSGDDCVVAAFVYRGAGTPHSYSDTTNGSSGVVNHTTATVAAGDILLNWGVAASFTGRAFTDPGDLDYWITRTNSNCNFGAGHKLDASPSFDGTAWGFTGGDSSNWTSISARVEIPPA